MTIPTESWKQSVAEILFDEKLSRLDYDELLSELTVFSPDCQLQPGSRLLVRGDIDVPLDASRERVEDPERLISLRETIEVCRAMDVVPVIFGHVGRDKDNSAKPLASEFERLFGNRCVFVSDWMNETTGALPDAARVTIDNAHAGDIVLLEQTRRYDLERALWGKQTAAEAERVLSDTLFDAALSLVRNVGGTYVFDALASHNPDWSSVVLPGAADKAFLGPYTYRELTGPLKAARNAEIVLISGLKIDKLDALEAIATRGSARLILCGGSLAMALVKASGGSIGLAEQPSSAGQKWHIPPERIEQAKRISRAASSNGVDLVVPVDFVLEDGTVTDVIPEGATQRDIGPRSIATFIQKIQRYVASRSNSTAIFYNGSVGQFEKEPFAAGTRAIVEALCDLARTDKRARLYVGGGDGRLTLARFGDVSVATHIFTSGGTVLKIIGDQSLNYLKALYVYSRVNAGAVPR